MVGFDMSLHRNRQLNRLIACKCNNGIHMLRILTTFACLLLFCCACSPRITLFPVPAETPLKERIVNGHSTNGKKGKILMIPLRGFITDYPMSGLLGPRPSMVQDVVSQLRLARSDANIKAVVLMVNSPGGTITASDILYHEISSYKRDTGAVIAACFLDLATSGAYYASLAADYIVAHPTSITGSVGTIMLKPELHGLMKKIGVDVKAYKSGELKDMGSMFREAAPREHELFEDIIHDLNRRFLYLAKTRRHLSRKKIQIVATGRLFTAQQAQDAGLVDQLGYTDDVLGMVRTLSGLPKDAPVIAFRRTRTANDNEYNITNTAEFTSLPLVDLGPLSPSNLRTGFYYLWQPAAP